MSEHGPVFTIGHSTHAAERFVALLRGHGVASLADVRRYPGSRRHPQFGQRELERALADAGIAYEWLGDDLGGRRRPVADSPHGGWRVEGFRGYADHMATPAFEMGLGRLETLAGRSRTCVMCAEAHPSRCHRRLIADALLARGWQVCHILPDGRLVPHELPAFAVIEAGAVSYPPAQGTLGA